MQRPRFSTFRFLLSRIACLGLLLLGVPRTASGADDAKRIRDIAPVLDTRDERITSLRVDMESVYANRMSVSYSCLYMNPNNFAVILCDSTDMAPLAFLGDNKLAVYDPTIPGIIIINNISMSFTFQIDNDFINTDFLFEKPKNLFNSYIRVNIKSLIDLIAEHLKVQRLDGENRKILYEQNKGSLHLTAFVNMKTYLFRDVRVWSEEMDRRSIIRAYYSNINIPAELFKFRAGKIDSSLMVAELDSYPPAIKRRMIKNYVSLQEVSDSLEYRAMLRARHSTNEGVTKKSPESGSDPRALDEKYVKAFREQIIGTKSWEYFLQGWNGERRTSASGTEERMPKTSDSGTDGERQRGKSKDSKGDIPRALHSCMAYAARCLNHPAISSGVTSCKAEANAA